MLNAAEEAKRKMAAADDSIDEDPLDVDAQSDGIEEQGDTDKNLLTVPG